MPPCPLDAPKADDIAYLQYSSGSTRFPHGVVITHRALMSNLAAHAHSMHIGQGDRGVSWLPFYHDMGLVGCMLSMVANQMSVDYLKTEDFARRPLAWLDLITRNKEQTMSYSPTFGYDICARRVSSQTDVAERFDLSRWRVAGNGADMIRPDVMQSFVDTFAAGRLRRRRASCRRYGLAEATLAVTVMPPGEGIVVELVEETLLAGGSAGERDRPQRYRAVVNCGKPVQGHGGRDPRRRRQRARRARDRQGLLPRHLGDGRLFPRRGGDRRPASTPTAGWTPATWAICPTAISTSSAAPRT